MSYNINDHKFPYKWTLKDSKFSKDKGSVFSCFACCGGSTMGYKLAGFDVIGDNEIDKKMNDIYVINHHPKFNFLCDIREMVEKAKNKELPDELYNIDILDASFPCTSFSTSGNREKDWGKEKKFREGQTKQVLDTLCFETINLTSYLNPKVVVCENVKGLILGNAIKYFNSIKEGFENIGYTFYYKLINASDMGVPQRRERVFMIAIRNDISEKICCYSDLFGNKNICFNLDFNEPPILFNDIRENDVKRQHLTDFKTYLWNNKQDGDKKFSDINLRLNGKNSCFTDYFTFNDEVLRTITTNGKRASALWDIPYKLTDNEIIMGSTFPLDFDFCDESIEYICGMCVPPVMMAQVATQIYKQILSKMK